MKKILILAPYPPAQAPSQRFRFEHYLEGGEQRGFSLDYRGFWPWETWQILYKSGHVGAKIWGLIKGFWARFCLLWVLYRYDIIYVHREVCPLGPPFWAFVATKLWRKPMIYDFDDAIWLPNTTEQNRWAAWLKWPSKVAWLCRWARLITVGNAYLGDYARQYNEAVRLIPTVVNTETRHNRLQDQKTTRPALGWTGSHSTLRYLEELLPVLAELERDYDFDFFVICNEPKPNWDLKSLRFITWQEASEIEDLLRFHIGLMPLENDAWAAGKCGFKAIQYMALGIVPVVSPVGVNSLLVGQDRGRIADQLQTWNQHLRTLLEQAELRADLGQKARDFIIAGFSVQATEADFWLGFEEILASK